MLYSLIEALFKIVELVWNAPTWLVVLVIVLFAVLYFLAWLFGFVDGSGSSDSSEHGRNPSHTYADDTCLTA